MNLLAAKGILCVHNYEGFSLMNEGQGYICQQKNIGLIKTICLIC
jgi:hypothetical protein